MQPAIEYAENTVAWAKEELELSQAEIGRAIGADRRTLYRWRRHESKPSARHRQSLEKLNELRHLMDTGFRSAAAAQKWLHTAVPYLNGRTPYFVISQGELEEVLGLLAGMQAGAFR